MTSARSRSDIAFEIFYVINVSFKSHLEDNHTKYVKGNVASRPGRGHRSGFFQKTVVDGRWSTVDGRRSAVGGRQERETVSLSERDDVS